MAYSTSLPRTRDYSREFPRLIRDFDAEFYLMNRQEGEGEMTLSQLKRFERSIRTSDLVSSWLQCPLELRRFWGNYQPVGCFRSDLGRFAGRPYEEARDYWVENQWLASSTSRGPVDLWEMSDHQVNSFFIRPLPSLLTGSRNFVINEANWLSRILNNAENFWSIFPTEHRPNRTGYCIAIDIASNLGIFSQEEISRVKAEMAAELGQSSGASQDPAPEREIISLLNWAKGQEDQMTEAELAYINEPASIAPEPTLWKEWVMLAKEDQPGGAWPAKPKRKIAPFGVLEAETPVPPVRCRKLAIWLPQDLDDEDLAAREAIIQEKLATTWVGKKRAVAVLVQRHFRRQGKRNIRLIRWARDKKAAEERAAREEAERIAKEEEERAAKEEELARQQQIEADAQLAAQTEAELAIVATPSGLPVAEAYVEEVVGELAEEETEEEGVAPPVARRLININENEFADSNRIRRAMAAAKTVVATARCPALNFGPTELPRFGDETAWAKYLTLGKKPTSSERPFHPEALAAPEFRARCEDLGIARLVELNEWGSIELIREIYANLLWRIEEKRTPRFKVRGRILNLTAESIDAFLGREELTEEELEIQHAEWAEILNGLPNDSTRGWEFISELFATEDPYVYTEGKNFKFIAWQHIQQAHRDLAPLLQWVQSNLIINQHSSDAQVLQFFVISKLLRKAKFSVGDIIRRDLVRLASTSRNTMGHVQILMAMCREAGVPISQEECQIKPGQRIPLTGECCNLLRVPAFPHCGGGAGSRRRTPVQVDEDAEDEIPLAFKKKSKKSAPPPQKAKGKAVATSSAPSSSPLLIEAPAPPPLGQPDVEFPEFANEDISKLGLYMQAMLAQQEARHQAEVAVLNAKVDQLQRELNAVKDISETGLLTIRAMAEDANSRELPIYLTKSETAKERKGKGKARD